MNTFKQIIKSLAAVTVVSILAFSLSGKVGAQQIPYNPGGTGTTTTPVFNTFTNVPNGVGNEADFVKLRKSNGDPTVVPTGNSFVDPLSDACSIGTKFDIRTYVHNGADPDKNNNGTGTAVAHNVQLAMQAPLGTTASQFKFTSTISASNAASVTDSGTLNCAKAVQLKLVPQTVNVYTNAYGWKSASNGAVNGSLKLGSRQIGSGDVWACWDDRVLVVYVVEVVEAPKPPTPSYTCDLLSKVFVSDNKYRFTTKATGKFGATVKQYNYNFGDKSSVMTTDKNVVDHSFPGPGTYVVSVVVDFDVNGQVKSVGGENCKTTVVIPKDDKCPVPGKEHLPKDSPECKETPVELPNTGPGSIAGMFAATSFAGALAHKFVYDRRRK